MTAPLRLVLFGLIVIRCPPSNDSKHSTADLGPEPAVPETSAEAVRIPDVAPVPTQERDEAADVEGGEPTDARASSWYEPLLSGAVSDELDDDGDPTPPPSCPPEARSLDDHHCWFDVVASWRFEDLQFDTPVDLDLSIPARPAKRNWVKAKGRIPWNELRAALDIQHTRETNGLTVAPHIMNYKGEDTPLPDDTTPPFFWWPSDGTPILVLPNRQKLRRLRFMGVTLARETEAGWRAINVEVVTSKHDGWGGSAMLESGVGLRVDGRELFTLAQIGDENEPGRVQQRHLCRIRWEGAQLARACVDTWKDTGYP